MDVYDVLLIAGVIGTMGLVIARDRRLRSQEGPVTRSVLVAVAVVSVSLALLVRFTEVPAWLIWPSAAGLLALCFTPAPIVMLGRWITGVLDRRRVTLPDAD